jgi:putative membrane protein
MSAYDPHRWTSHLFDIRGSLVREILGRVSLCVLWSAVVVAAHQLLPDVYFDWEIPETAHVLLGGALGLLLVFRTNSSYDRFWEGRKLWGAIVNETRNLARQSSVLLAAQPTTVRQTILWTISFAYASMYRLRGLKQVGGVATELPSDQVAAVLASQHVPLAVARQITGLLKQARADGLITDIQQMALDQNVQLLIDYIGGCERIHSTPLPYAYAVHLRRALIAYCFTLPFALVARFGWDTIPAVLLIAYIFFGIEEIGVEIEDPFGEDDNDLPLEQICTNIERNLRDVIGAPLPEAQG